MTLPPADTVRAVADVIQWLLLAVIVATLALALDAGRRWRGARPFLAGLLTLAAHEVIFYVCALARVIPGPWVSLWSAALRLHSSVYILAMLVVFYVVARRPWRPWWVDGGDEGGGDDE
jgi:hypothetical protein